MRQVNIRTLKAQLSFELSNLPFQITKNGAFVACVFPPNMSLAKRESLLVEIHENELQEQKELEFLGLTKKDDKKLRLIRKLKKTGCMVCGYNKSFRGLHFHHINGKSQQINKLKKQEIIKEFKNYDIVLLCANCHAEVHDNMLDISYLNPIDIKAFINKKTDNCSHNGKPAQKFVGTAERQSAEIAKKKQKVSTSKATIPTDGRPPFRPCPKKPKGKE